MSKQWRFCVKLVTQVLLLKFTKQKSDREVGRLHLLSKNTVKTYVTRAEAAGVKNLEQLESNSDERLKEIIFPYPVKAPQKIPLDFNWIHKELARPHVILALLWKELNSQNENFYQYSWFCELYRDWEKSRETSMRVPHDW
jgi:transposase